MQHPVRLIDVTRRTLFSLALTALAAACATTNAIPGRQDRLTLPENMRFDRQKQELIIDFPSMDLPIGRGYDHGGVTTTLNTTAPFDGWLHGYEIQVLDSNNTEMGRGFLHHMNILGPDQRELFAPIMIHIVASGMETKPVRMPNSVGYPVKRGDRLVLVAMLHNPTGSAQNKLRVRARIPVTLASTGKLPKSAFPFFLGVSEPGAMAEFDLPPGRSVHMRKASPAVSGRIYAIGGHLHQFGESVRLEDLTTGKVLWEGIATVDSLQNIESIPTKRFPRGGVHIKASHAYRVTAVYNNTTGETRKAGGMAAIGGVFIPDHYASWPAVNHSDPIYQRDFNMRFGAAPAHVHR